MLVIGKAAMGFVMEVLQFALVEELGKLAIFDGNSTMRARA